ncbi:MAG: hypothetical protein DRJ61_04065 [Acidobacteria bacterium]|nr:MAG: hypothetical protein DRJ61_04065 [Acidobacteriota bacterium]
MRKIIVIVVIVLAAGAVFADDVYLRGGGQITGVIVEQSEESVTVDIGGGTLTARMSSVVRIEKRDSPLQEYRTRAEGIPPDDAEAWRELAQWATGETLSSQASEAYSYVIAVLPDDHEANRALGRVLLDGKWVTEEESYRARGFVEFEGEWLTRDERIAIIKGRKAREKEDRQANDAAIQAINDEQEAEAEREREAAEREEARRYNSINWGWGAGPSYWPSSSGSLSTNPADSSGVWR